MPLMATTTPPGPAQKIDQEVRCFVDEGYQSATNILKNNRLILERIAKPSVAPERPAHA